METILPSGDGDEIEAGGLGEELRWIERGNGNVQNINY